MSDKTYWLNKLIKRQYAKGDFLRVDGGGAPSWSSTLTVVGVAVMIFGLLSYFTQGLSFIWLMITIAGGVVTLANVIAGKIMSIYAFSEFIYRYDDKELFFQYIGKKHIVFACDGVVLEFKNRQVSKVNSIYRPQYSMTTITDVLYTSRLRKGENLFYFGQTQEENDGKKKVYKYKVKLNKDNKMESYSVNGKEIVFNYVAKGSMKLSLPINLYNEIRALGINLPGDEVIQIVYDF